LIVIDSVPAAFWNMKRANTSENSRLREQGNSDLPFHARIAGISARPPAGTSNFKQAKAAANDHVAVVGHRAPASSNAVTTHGDTR
jgi:hypothetical protein